MGNLISTTEQTTIALIILKLANVIHWSWWWIFCGLWVPAAFTLLALGAWLLWRKFLIGETK